MELNFNCEIGAKYKLRSNPVYVPNQIRNTMAEVVIDLVPENTTAIKPLAKLGCKSRLTTPEDLIIVQEVAAAEAHVAPHGETLVRLETSSEQAMKTTNSKHSVTAKNIPDLFKKLLGDYAVRDANNRNGSGVDGDIGELDDLLGEFLEARKDIEAKKNGNARGRVEQEQNKIATEMELEMKKLAAEKDLILNALRGKDRVITRDRSHDYTPTKTKKQ